VQVRKPATIASREFLVRLWEVERAKASKPEQLRSFKVTATSIDEAQRLARRELEATQRRVVRSLSYAAEGTIHAVVFKGLHRHAAPRDYRAERKAELESRRRRRARAPDPEAVKRQAAEVRQARSIERKRAVEQARKKRSREQEQADLAREADRRERHAKQKAANAKKLDREAEARARREADRAERTERLLAKRTSPKPTADRDVVGR
jgi:type IV secretory pathway VirB10-like protein